MNIPRTFKPFILIRRINRLCEAAKEHAFLGSKHPDDHEAIEQEYRDARLALIDYIMEFIP